MTSALLPTLGILQERASDDVLWCVVAVSWPPPGPADPVLLRLDPDGSWSTVSTRRVGPRISRGWTVGPRIATFPSDLSPVEDGHPTFLVRIGLAPATTRIRWELVTPAGALLAVADTHVREEGDHADATRIQPWIAQADLVDRLAQAMAALDDGDLPATRLALRIARLSALTAGRSNVAASLDALLDAPDTALGFALMRIRAMVEHRPPGLAAGPTRTSPSGYEVTSGFFSTPAAALDATGYFGGSDTAPEPAEAEPPRRAPAYAARQSGNGMMGGAGLAPRVRWDPVVNTGFAERAAPHRLCGPDTTLVTDTDYLFWLDIGPPGPASIERTPTGLPPELPGDVVITVVLFGYPGEIGLDEDANTGTLHLRALRAPTVTGRMFTVDHDSWPSDRLAFPVRTPRRRGTARLRCNIYWRQLLLQSRMVEVTTTPTARAQPGALRSVLDFRVLDPSTTLAGPRYAASLQLDATSIGTHGLRVVADGGDEVLRAEATIGERPLITQIELARSALRRAAWGNDDPWREGLAYRYATPPPRTHLAEDLISLAVNGFRLNHLLMRGLAGSAGTDAYSMADTVRSAMSEPGYVQIALREGASHVFPAALLYDLPLDTQADRLRLCPDFEHALDHDNVMSADCLRGRCRQARTPDDTVVCPGGFWGYRHALGMPVSVRTAHALPAHLDGRGGGRVIGGVYRDFERVERHRTALGALATGLRVDLAEDRASTLRALRSHQPHVVYFYCHGGVEHSVPYLRVGQGTSDPVITPDNLFHNKILWNRHRPLVFLNGCRTTGLSPETAIDFVSFFVQDALACGVIGTEITVFEDLAATFAEECLRAFLGHGLPIGLAVRHARIALLAQGNPLGLAYIPFILPTIHYLPRGIVA